MIEGGEVRRGGEEVKKKHFPPLPLSKVVVLGPGELLWTGLLRAAPVRVIAIGVSSVSSVSSDTHMKWERKHSLPGERVRQLVFVHGDHRHVHNLMIMDRCTTMLFVQ